jgi:hypothetical protein
LAGGIFAGEAATAQALVQPSLFATGAMTEAALVGTRVINVTGAVSLLAHMNAAADADASGIELAAGTRGKANALALLTPRVEASLGDGSLVTAGGGISLRARFNSDDFGANTNLAPAKIVKASAFAVAGGLLFATEGAEANALDHSLVRAFVPAGVTLNGGSGPILLLAASFSTLQANSDGVAVGGLYTRGNSVALASYDGSTRANLLGTVTGGGSLDVNSFATANTKARARALSAGIVGGNGADADALVKPGPSGNPLLQSSLGSNAITLSGRISLLAVLNGAADADAQGLEITLLGLGGHSHALAELTPIVDASIAAGGTLSSGSGGISLAGRYNSDPFGFNTNLPVTAKANAIAVAASGLVGSGGAEALAHDATIVDLLVPSTVTLLPGSGVVSVLAASYSNLQANSDGFAVSGLFAKGNSVATSLFDGRTRARLETNILSGGGLELTARSTANTQARAIALAGGIFAGEAATAQALVQPSLFATGAMTEAALVGTRVINVTGRLVLKPNGSLL